MRNERLKKQPSLHSTNDWMKAYYKEIYEECGILQASISTTPLKDPVSPSLPPSSTHSLTGLGLVSQHPTLDQLRKLRFIYTKDIEAMNILLHECRTKFHKCYSVICLQNSLYTAKKMIMAE